MACWVTRAPQAVGTSQALTGYLRSGQAVVARAHPSDPLRPAVLKASRKIYYGECRSSCGLCASPFEPFPPNPSSVRLSGSFDSEVRAPSSDH